MANTMTTETGVQHKPIEHPLEPLTAQEIEAAVAIVRRERAASELVRFVSVKLHEDDPVALLNFKAGDPITRAAFMALLDKGQDPAATYEAIVNITEGIVTSWKHIEGVQPGLMFEEFFACEEVVKKDPRFVEALAKRGITNLDLVNVDPWSAGNYGEPEENTRRILRTTVHMRRNPDDLEENSYAHPVEGLHAIVDLGTNTVIRIDDFGIIPVPEQYGNYLPKDVGPLRSDLKPIVITQPEGPSFTVDGHHVRWQKWDFRIGYAPREGLILYHVFYDDQGRRRPILRRAALAEMVVPYGDTSLSHARQNAFDVGEYGVGWLGNALELGCDCLGNILYFDAHMTDSAGTLLTLPNVVCMHEEDVGMLWKHTNFRTGHVETRRSRRLVVSFIATVGIYEYGFFWYFYQDGSLEMDIKLTGIMNTAAVRSGEEPLYGELLAPGLYSPNHQHFFCFRLDPMIDGLNNSVEEMDTVPVPMGKDNPYGNAFAVKRTRFVTEQEAQRELNAASARFWRIINPSVLNPMTGRPVGFELKATGVMPFANLNSSVQKRATFMQKHVWVTPYHPDEQYPAGEYPNQHPGGAGLPAWTAANRSIDDTQIVVWHTVGVHHVPRIEDWPVMPVSHAGFMLRPHGFFTQNPALDVPSPMMEHKHGEQCES